MATTYLTPGVYIEEIDRGPKPIQGVGTNVTAFIGFTEKAEEPDTERPEEDRRFYSRSCLGKAMMITNWSQYEQHFGKLTDQAYLPYAVRGFFENGGIRCYVISIRSFKPLPGQLLIYARDPKQPDNPKKNGVPSLLINTKESVPAGAEVKVSIHAQKPAAASATTNGSKNGNGADPAQATPQSPSAEEPPKPNDPSVPPTASGNNGKNEKSGNGEPLVAEPVVNDLTKATDDVNSQTAAENNGNNKPNGAKNGNGGNGKKTPGGAPTGELTNQPNDANTPSETQNNGGNGGGNGDNSRNNGSDNGDKNGNSVNGGTEPKADFWLEVEYIMTNLPAGEKGTPVKRKAVPVELDKLPLYGEPQRGASNDGFQDLQVWRLTKGGPSALPLENRLPKPAVYNLTPAFPMLDVDLFEEDIVTKNQLQQNSSEETAATIFKQKSTALFEGSEPKRKAIGALEALDDVSLICAPDLMMALKNNWIDSGQLIDLQKSLLAHCERRDYRFAILDAPSGKSPKDIYDWRMKEANLDAPRGHGALYYPWIKIQDPVTNQAKFIPPCGHIAGIYSRSDSERGVFKAPANEQVRFCTDVQINVTRGEQDLLNPVGINCIRAFPGRGIRVWGARTLSSDPAWRYINVRRLFNYVEQSIEENTQWIVFEPNDAFLWARVRRDITAFLRTVWLSGALFGNSPQEAFYVKCDAETNPRELRDLGQMVCEIGMAPVKPAEFVIFRFTQWAGPGTEA